MKELTLGDCFEQEEGTQGRLFRVGNNVLPFGENNIADYRVIERTGDTMTVEGYVLGGSIAREENVPVQERLGDKVMSSDLLLEWYRMAGVAGSPTKPLGPF